MEEQQNLQTLVTHTLLSLMGPPPSRASSSGFFRSTYSSSNSLEPGDTIVVPLKIDTFSGIRATTEITQVLYQLAVAAAAVSSFNN